MSERAAGGAPDGDRAEAKRRLRQRFRAVRRSVADPDERSQRIWQALAATTRYRDADSVLLFDSIPGEPHTAAWKTAAALDGKMVWVPEDDALPTAIDLVVVPGVAFSVNGDRLGQGGGWYDRYLAAAPATTSTIGVCFAEQLVEVVPVEAHDRRVDLVICERGIVAQNGTFPSP